MHCRMFQIQSLSPSQFLHHYSGSVSIWGILIVNDYNINASCEWSQIPVKIKKMLYPTLKIKKINIKINKFFSLFFFWFLFQLQNRFYFSCITVCFWNTISPMRAQGGNKIRLPYEMSKHVFIKQKHHYSENLNLESLCQHVLQKLLTRLYQFDNIR
jgi:hypothetical protein